jgi:hypothetical protein
MYLVVGGNFLANLFGCRIQSLLSSDMRAKHLLGFLTMYFFIVLVDKNASTADPNVQLLATAAVYTTFVITTKMDIRFWSPFMVLLALFYVMQIYKENDKTDKKTKKVIGILQKVILGVNAALLIAGFLVYMGKKKAEFGPEFKFGKFMLGRVECANNGEGQGKSLSVLDSVRALYKA